MKLADPLVHIIRVALVLALLFGVVSAFASGDCRTTEVEMVRRDSETTYWVCEGYVCGSLRTTQVINPKGWNVVHMRTDAVVNIAPYEWISIWTECRP
jgi:hypothetical protein